MEQETLRLIETIKIAQYTYKLGVPLYQDSVYDDMIHSLSQIEEGDFNHHWEDMTDEEGWELLEKYEVADIYRQYIQSMGEKKFNENLYLKEIPASEEVISRYREYKPTPNKSIPIVSTAEEYIQVVEHMAEDINSDVFLSLKEDGWNITAYIENGEIVYAHTRGRQAKEKDITTILNKILEKRELNIEHIKQGIAIGELVLSDKELIQLRTKYRKDFKTTRNSLSSFINNTIIAEDLPRADFDVFRIIEEGKEFETYSEMFEYAEEVGFRVPPWKVVKIGLQTVYNAFLEYDNKINSLPPSDGVVIQPNKIEYKESLNQMGLFPSSYEVGLYALKLGNWGKQVYKTYVEDIVFTRNTKTLKPSLIVNPVKTRDGREITTIPVDHIGRLVDENIYIGKEISISIVSEKDIRMVYDREKADLRVKM